MVYVEPDIKSTDFSREDFKEWYLRIVEECRKQNNDTFDQIRNAYALMMSYAKTVYGDGSRQVKYLKREGFEYPPDLNRLTRSVFKRYEKWFDKQKSKETQKKNEVEKQKQVEKQQIIDQAKRQEYRRRRMMSDEELQELGYVPGRDYNPKHAITFHKQVMKQKESESNGSL